MKKELAQAEKRLTEIDNLFSKLYEDRAKGKVSERNFLMLTNKYQNEQKSMEEKITDYSERIKQTAQGKEHAEKWVSLIRKYTSLTELTAPLLNELIEKIVVHEATKAESEHRSLIFTTALSGRLMDSRPSGDLLSKRANRTYCFLIFGKPVKLCRIHPYW